jgi:tetratricopeptide (TPR) repeat protein
VNKVQKKVMIAVAIGLMITFLFPPQAIFLSNGNAIKMGYGFIANIPRQYSIYMAMLFAEWLGIAVLGGIAYVIAKDTQREYIPQPQANSSNDSVVVQSSSPANNAIKKSSSWNWIWPGFLGVIIIKLFGPACGLVTIGAFYWLRPKLGTWGAVTASGVLGTVVVVGLTYWFGATAINIQQPTPSSTNIQLPTPSSNPYVWPSTNIQQPTALSTDSDQDIFERANNLYGQGKYSEALPLYQQLARYSGAQISLGGMYESGNGVTKDYNQAIYWYRKAAEQGDENEKDARAALNKLISLEKNKTPYQVQTQPVQTQQTKPSSVKKIKKANKNRGDLRNCLSLGSNKAIAQCVGEN